MDKLKGKVISLSFQVFERKCFLYSNGLMDHLYPRLNGEVVPKAAHTKEEICNCKWYNRPKYFNGTIDAFIKISRYSLNKLNDTAESTSTHISEYFKAVLNIRAISNCFENVIEVFYKVKLC